MSTENDTKYLLSVMVITLNISFPGNMISEQFSATIKKKRENALLKLFQNICICVFRSLSSLRELNGCDNF